MLSRDFSSILNCPMHFLHLVSFESIYASKVYVITVPGDSQELDCTVEEFGVYAEAPLGQELC